MRSRSHKVSHQRHRTLYIPFRERVVSTAWLTARTTSAVWWMDRDQKNFFTENRTAVKLMLVFAILNEVIQMTQYFLIGDFNTSTSGPASGSVMPEPVGTVSTLSSSFTSFSTPSLVYVCLLLISSVLKSSAFSAPTNLRFGPPTSSGSPFPFFAHHCFHIFIHLCFHLLSLHSLYLVLLATSSTCGSFLLLFTNWCYRRRQLLFSEIFLFSF